MTAISPALDVLADAGAVAELVELGAVGGGRRLRLGEELVVDGPRLLTAIDKGDLELEEVVGGVDGDISDEAAVELGNGSMPFTAQAHIGGEVACCEPQAKPVHVLAMESG